MNLHTYKTKIMINQNILDEQLELVAYEEFNSLNQNSPIHIVCITSYPDRTCGIATFSKDLRENILSVFGNSVHISICAIESNHSENNYDFPVEYILEDKITLSYSKLAESINQNPEIDAVLIQHEFGLFGGDLGENILIFLHEIKKPVVTTFHTVLPYPSIKRKFIVQSIAQISEKIIVMTENSSSILQNEYDVYPTKIEVIPHGMHLISLKDKEELKTKYFLNSRKVLSTFGLINSGKGIETALFALPEIIKENPNCIYLIIGKTHPEVLKKEGEKYREYLVQIIDELKLHNHTLFVNKFVTNEDLLEFLQMTDIYLFTSKDPHQAVSGTFTYAMGCNCPIISTQFPHAIDSLGSAGILIDHNDSKQLSQSTNYLFRNPDILNSMRINALEKSKSSAWQNIAIKNLNLLNNNTNLERKIISYQIPTYNLIHINNLTHSLGIIQFSKAEIPDLNSGFTLDDNARALIAVTQYFELTKDENAINLINTYFNFIEFMQQDGGEFLNYLDKYGHFTLQNFEENLEDSNGRAIWALGYFYSKRDLFDKQFNTRIEELLENSLQIIGSFDSPRAIAFTIKGLYNFNEDKNSLVIYSLILDLADKLISFYQSTKNTSWYWFEDKLTYGNAILSEALLYAYDISKNEDYKEIAVESFEFLLSVLFEKEHFTTISNRTWHQIDEEVSEFGEQPIEVAYTIMALEKFNEFFQNKGYDIRMKKAFDWYHGHNRLNQIVYNPLTGGCCDGIEHDRVNINQGAESTITYLMARNSIERQFLKVKKEELIFTN
jgi:glycosyltransferase involved in cell wall biosynthesis